MAHYMVYAGTFTHRGARGIYRYRLDTDTGALIAGGPPLPLSNPAFLAFGPGKRHLYTVNEQSEFMGQKSGGVSALAVAPKTGELRLLNQQLSHGTSPCHLSVDSMGRYVFVANYGSGTVAMLPILDDGRLGQASDVVQHHGASGVNPARQEGPHAHSVTISPDDRFAFVCDLGLDRVMIYRIDYEKGQLLPNDPPWVEANPGSGPRHFAFHPTHRYAYVINELDSTITAYACDHEQGALSPLQTISTLPEKVENTCADLHVAPSGHFLYGSNRGHDSIAIFAIDPGTGKLTPLGHESTRGKTPRNFALTPDGRYLLAANRDSDNITVFLVDQESGQLEFTGHEVHVSTPVCIRLIPTRQARC